MVSIDLKNQALTAEYKANAAISDQELVALVGANAVAPAVDTEAQQTVGVADEAAASGDTVRVVLLGRKTVVADGAINPGDPVRAAATAGRVVAETNAPATSHTHNLPGDASGTTVNAELDGSGNLAVGGGGSIEAADPAPEHARVAGKAIGSASAAGDAIDILVVLTG